MKKKLIFKTIGGVDYWVDELNNNLWDAEVFNEYEAKRASDSLVECNNNLDCVNCYKCCYCTSCRNCSRCYGGDNCAFCEESNMCTQCTDCMKCDWCYGAVLCIKCYRMCGGYRIEGKGINSAN